MAVQNGPLKNSCLIDIENGIVLHFLKYYLSLRHCLVTLTDTVSIRCCQVLHFRSVS